MSETPRPDRPLGPPADAGLGEGDRSPSFLTVLNRQLRPVPTSHTAWWESAVVLVAAAAIGYFRLGRAPLRGVVWAEDGAVFLADAYHSNLLTGAFEPYNGYALFQPRVLAELISWAPLTWQGQLMSATAALCQALVALLAFHVVRAHARTRIPPLLVALVVAAVPVGMEVIDNLANGQWFLLAGAVLAVFWSPARWPGRVASAVVVFVAATSCPFGAFAAALAVAGWLVDRTRAHLPIALAGLTGAVIQVWVALHAPPRSGPMDPGLDLGNLVGGYLRRVVGDGVLGIGRHGQDVSPTVVPGLLVLLLVTLMAVMSVVRRRADRLMFPAVLTLCSMVLFAAPAYLTQPNTEQSYSEGRYWVAPVILLVTAFLLVAETAWLDRREPAGWGPAVLAVVLVAATLYGLVTSWRVPSWDPRLEGPDWQAQVARARHHCERHPHEPAVLNISPPGWTVTLTCDDLR